MEVFGQRAVQIALKVFDLVLEQPVATADARDEDDVLAHPVSMDLIAAASTQNDHVVDPYGGLTVGSGGLPLNGLDTDPFPLAVVEIQ